ncbi:N-acetyltransferase [Clostridia bacterium]|nr:N-acetyltransferase [Clostridia bacterium]
MYMENIKIRPMVERDVSILANAFIAQGWADRTKSLSQYVADQNKGLKTALVAECEGVPAGYLTITPSAHGGPFNNQNIPEIKDFNVLIKYRRRGIGTNLMDAAEEIAKKTANAVSLAVGLYPDYGAAQILYIKRGYVPDGGGIWYAGKRLSPYEPCVNDDDLNLYMIKNFA